MTLHEAIITVLRDEPDGLSVKEIAQRIADNDLYRREMDGHSPPETQVRWRISKYPQFLEVDRFVKPQRITLK